MRRFIARIRPNLYFESSKSLCQVFEDRLKTLSPTTSSLEVSFDNIPNRRNTIGLYPSQYVSGNFAGPFVSSSPVQPEFGTNRVQSLCPSQARFCLLFECWSFKGDQVMKIVVTEELTELFWVDLCDWLQNKAKSLKFWFYE